MHDFFHNRTVLITQPISITHIHTSLASVWEVNFVVFISMLKYAINRIMHTCFHTRTVIMPRPISTLGLIHSGRYWSLGMITVLVNIANCFPNPLANMNAIGNSFF